MARLNKHAVGREEYKCKMDQKEEEVVWFDQQVEKENARCRQERVWKRAKKSSWESRVDAPWSRQAESQRDVQETIASASSHAAAAA